MTTLVELEREHILSALRECKGVISGPSGAAAKLGMHRSTLLHRIKKHGMTRDEVNGLAPESDQPAATQEASRSPVVTEERMLRVVTRKPKPKRRLASAIYATTEYVARHVFRGDEKMVSYARLVAEDGDSRFQAFVEAWDADRASLLPNGAHKSLSTLVKESGINSIDFCVEVMRACMKRNIDVSNILVAIAYPQVTDRNISQALKPKGVRDREMFFQHTGWLPVPRGSIVQVNAQAAAAAVANTSVGEKTENTSMPDFEEMTVEGSKIVRREFEEP
jgi:hypothetical protein